LLHGYMITSKLSIRSMKPTKYWMTLTNGMYFECRFGKMINYWT
jgi:hypothetical protein